jgi:hypothetical protein
MIIRNAVYKGRGLEVTLETKGIRKTLKKGTPKRPKRIVTRTETIECGSECADLIPAILRLHAAKAAAILYMIRKKVVNRMRAEVPNDIS